MKKKYIKSDATECEAHIGATRIVNDNFQDTYCGKIIFADNGLTLFSYSSQTERLTREDAMQDAIDALHDGQFGSWR